MGLDKFKHNLSASNNNEPTNRSLDPPEDTPFLGRPPLHPSTPRGRSMEISQQDGYGIDYNSHGNNGSWRKILLLFIIASLVAIVLIVSSKEDERIEEGLLIGEVETVTHQQHNEFNEDMTMSATGAINESESVQMNKDGDEPNSEIGNNEAIKEKGNKSLLIGFHDPSPQSFITSATYLKPKGVGYPLRPVGGLHPVYLADDESAPTTVEGDYAIASPYADPRLKMSDDERVQEQADYVEKLQSIRDEWGVWNFVDARPDRPTVDWEGVGEKKEGYDVLHGEIESDEFGSGVWQGDDEYIKNFHIEARALIKRVKEAIYAEYGVPTSKLSPAELSQRDIQLGVHLVKEGDPAAKAIDPSLGVAWMHEPSFHALAKKLLNAMMTNDHFFVVLGGHSAAAGHGNNFHQSYMMQFQEVMEPVFDRLGMVLVSSNRAQGGMGTLQAALAGETIYGQKDVMLWDSSMTEKGGGHQDLFHRQMLLTGHRVPVLLDMGGGKGTMDRLHEESGAHVGGITTGTPSVLALTKSVEQAETMPFALRHLFCDKGVTTCTEGKYKYAASCWTDRVDVEPVTKQNEGYGGQVSWHPGNKSHQWVGRKLSLLFLNALEEAINLWESAASSDGNPIPGKYWHLSEDEKAIRDKLRSVDVATTECGKMLTKLPRLCATPMRGATEWAPRADADHSSIRSLLKPAPNGYVPELLDIESPPQLYGGRDPHIPTQNIPKGEVDVAAIARSIPPPATKDRRMFVSAKQRPLSLENGSGLIQSSNIEGYGQLRKQTLRHLASDIVPGEGWGIKMAPAGFCDGTSNQVCKREPSFECLMSGHSDSRGDMIGDALSGWLTFSLKDVSHGIFAARLEYWHPHNSNERTDGWVADNNGRKDDRRVLKPPPPPLPDDFMLKVAVDGVLKHTLDGDELKTRIEPHIAYNVPFIALIDDEEMAKKNQKVDMEVSIRLEGSGRESIVGITHVYYA